MRTLSRILELRETGITVSAIAEALNAEGHKSRSGKPWNMQTVRIQIARLEDYPNLRADMARTVKAKT